VQLQHNSFEELPISIAHAVAAARLPLHHRDPFDRMLIAQASLESLTLLTSDSRLKEYGTPIILA
jgi:PIN domain nuclease of toxin-antitoxin system